MIEIGYHIFSIGYQSIRNHLHFDNWETVSECIETIESEGNDIVNDELRLLHDGLITATTTSAQQHTNTPI